MAFLICSPPLHGKVLVYKRFVYLNPTGEIMAPSSLPHSHRNFRLCTWQLEMALLKSPCARSECQLPRHQPASLKKDVSTFYSIRTRRNNCIWFISQSYVTTPCLIAFRWLSFALVGKYYISVAFKFISFSLLGQQLLTHWHL